MEQWEWKSLLVWFCMPWGEGVVDAVNGKRSSEDVKQRQPTHDGLKLRMVANRASKQPPSLISYPSCLVETMIMV